LVGYDIQKQKITDSAGGLSLLTTDGRGCSHLALRRSTAHWNRKHARAAYVPSNVREAPTRQYRFGDRVRLAVGTDFLFFLRAVAQGAIYYDPGIKMEGRFHAHPQIKRRSQFRIKSSQIPLLYRAVDEVDLGLIPALVDLKKQTDCFCGVKNPKLRADLMPTVSPISLNKVKPRTPMNNRAGTVFNLRVSQIYQSFMRLAGAEKSHFCQNSPILHRFSRISSDSSSRRGWLSFRKECLSTSRCPFAASGSARKWASLKE